MIGSFGSFGTRAGMNWFCFGFDWFFQWFFNYSGSGGRRALDRLSCEMIGSFGSFGTRAGMNWFWFGLIGFSNGFSIILDPEADEP